MKTTLGVLTALCAVVFLGPHTVRTDVRKSAVEDQRAIRTRHAAEGGGIARLQHVFATGRLVAYTPRELDPRPGHFRAATPAGIQEDLDAIKPFFDTLVTYSCNPAQGLDAVVPIAAANEMRVILGIWDPKSVREVERAVSLSLNHPATVVGLVIANESLLTNRANEEDLEAAARLVRAATADDLPISVSEPISSYGSQFLQEFGDFYAPNCHHLFNGVEKTDVEAAIAWLRGRCDALRTRGDKPILVKESGIPSAPEPFTPELQALYWKRVAEELPNTPDRAVVVFEAMSLPFKVETQASELAAAEAHYGLWDDELRPKLAVKGLPRRP